MDIDAVFTGLADAVNNAQLTGNTVRVTASAFMPDFPEVPHFYPYTFRGAYDKTFGGTLEVTVTAHLLLSRAEQENAIGEATRLAGTGTNTIFAAIEAARGPASATPTALGGAADEVTVRSVEGPRLFDFGDGAPKFWGLEFTIFVIGD